jgi:hypothetical protein
MNPPAASVVMITRQKGAFHVTRATMDDSEVQAELEAVQEGQQYRVTLTYAGGWEPGLRQKVLVVTTDDPKQREIRIPVQVMVQGPPGAGTTVAAH